VEAFAIYDYLASPYAVYGQTATQPNVLVGSATTRKITGRDPKMTDALAAVYNADPSDIWVWTIVYQSIAASTTTTTQATVVLDYDVEFFDRLDSAIDVRLERLKSLSQRSDRKKLPDLSDDDEKAWSDLDSAVQSARAEGSTRTETGGLGKPLLRQPVPTQPAQVSSRRSDVSRDKGDRKN
jgi:hypothetical protein